MRILSSRILSNHGKPVTGVRKDKGFTQYVFASCLNYLVYDQQLTFVVVAKLISDIGDKHVVDVSKYNLKMLVKSLVKQMA